MIKLAKTLTLISLVILVAYSFGYYHGNNDAALWYASQAAETRLETIRHLEAGDYQSAHDINLETLQDEMATLEQLDSNETDIWTTLEQLYSGLDILLTSRESLASHSEELREKFRHFSDGSADNKQ